MHTLQITTLAQTNLPGAESTLITDIIAANLRVLGIFVESVTIQEIVYTSTTKRYLPRALRTSTQLNKQHIGDTTSHV